MLEPKDQFWTVKVKVMTQDEKGKDKTVIETHLVDGPDLTSVEAKVKEEMDGTIADYEIVSSSVSKVMMVY